MLLLLLMLLMMMMKMMKYRFKDYPFAIFSGKCRQAAEQQKLTDTV